MDDQLKTTSTSPDSIFSELSSHDSGINAGSVPTMSAMSVISPLRLSVTLANMSDIASSFDEHGFFRDDYSSRRTSSMSWWQSDAENSNQQYHYLDQTGPQLSPQPRYLVTDFRTNRNIPSSSITDVLSSPRSRLSTSSSFMSLSSIGSQKATNQRSFRPVVTNTASNDHDYSSLTAQYRLPVATSLSNRQTLSSIDNLSSIISDNDLQRVPPSFANVHQPTAYGSSSLLRTHQPQPQVVHTAGRSNSMPSWRGYLPLRFEPTTVDQYHTSAHFSQKVFLGGIPAELTEAELLLVLRKFGKCNIKWPKSDGLGHSMPGFCHVVFRESRSVCELLKHCTRQQRSTIDYFLHIHMSPSLATTTTSASGHITAGAPSLRHNRLKPIQVVPWNVKDNVYVVHQENIPPNDASYKDWSRTIFVSPLHGKMTAFSLATIMSSVFGAVSMAQINTDKYGYPTGTGTVLFCDSHSYMRAVAAGAIDIKCDCFHKLLDIDPFLRENEPCAFCSSVADLFCRNFHCLRSYCKQCWVNRHGPKPLADHQPATRRQQPLPHI